MAITRLSDMIVVPEKFASYVEDRTVQKSLMVNSGIATADGTVAQLINGTPKGGRFIEIPAWNELEGDPSVFGETPLDATGITTKSWSATLQIWQKAWGATDLAKVLGGVGPYGSNREFLFPRIGEISTNRRFTLLFLRRFLTRLRAHLRHTLTIFQQEAAQRQIFLMAQRLTLSRRSAIITTVLAWYLCTRQYIRTYKKTV